MTDISRDLNTLSRAARAVWLFREDVRELCNHHPAAFLAWCYLEGKTAYAVFDPAHPEFESTPLETAWEGSPAGLALPITQFMHSLWCRRVDLHDLYDVTQLNGAQGFWSWFVVNGVREMALSPLLTESQRDWLTEPAQPLIVDQSCPPLSRVMLETWSRRDDLQATFPLSDGSDRQRFGLWFMTEGLREIGNDRLLGEEWGAWARINHLKIDAGKPDASRSSGPQPLRFPLRRDGVNVFGHATAQMGIGEDARMMVAALDAVGIPSTVVNLSPGAKISDNDGTLLNRIRPEPLYDQTIFCTTGMEMARVLAVRGPKLIEGQYVIGAWPWEFDIWPDIWRFAGELVNEIWAASDHSAKAYRGIGGIPVHLTGMAVTLAPPAPVGRRGLGLPEDRFLFLTAFDTSSIVERKNPLAAIRAFQTAFGPEDRSVGLVIKVMRPEADPKTWTLLRPLIEADDRIVLLEQTLDRAALSSLYLACDALISLHRCEGFGRILAEMMLAERPVIATDFSGSCDFLTRETGFPVAHALVPVEPGQYPFADGLHWADPIQNDAVRAMQEVRDDPDLARRIALNGRAVIQEKYAPLAVGKRLSACLSGHVAELALT
jgi:glycosyltransferase involved in cell wall biosynthesis